MRMSRAAVFFGSVFTAVGLAYLFEDLGVWDLRAAFFLPVVLMVAGFALTVSALTSDRRT